MLRYKLFDYPLDGSEGDLETWCQSLADEGWRLWDAGIGGVIEHDGRMVRRISLRRLPPPRASATRTEAAYPQVTTPS